MKPNYWTVETCERLDQVEHVELFFREKAQKRQGLPTRQLRRLPVRRNYRRRLRSRWT